MSTIVQLPDGKTALFRDAAQVPERLRRPLMEAMRGALAGVEEFKVRPDGTILTDADGKPVAKTDEEKGREMMLGDGALAMTEGGDRAILALLENWDLDADRSIDGLLDLPGDTYQALYKAAAPHLFKLLPASFSPTTDPQSPTQPSGD